MLFFSYLSYYVFEEKEKKFSAICGPAEILAGGFDFTLSSIRKVRHSLGVFTHVPKERGLNGVYPFLNLVRSSPWLVSGWRTMYSSVFFRR